LLQTLVFRYADDFSGRTTTVIDEYTRRVGVGADRSQALRWKIGLNSSVLAIATSPNPNSSVLDFVSLATLTHTFLEERAAASTNEGVFDYWLDTSRLLETNAWKLAAQVFTTNQQAEFRTALLQWQARNTNIGATFFARPQDFATVIRQSAKSQDKAGSVFGLVGLDPMAGLDPAVREITRTRMFAERAMYTAQRMPTLLRWQMEFLAEETMGQEQLADALQSVDRLSRAAESASQTAALLPDRLAAERKAILDALEQQQGQLRELSAELGRTLTAGEHMSTSLNTTMTTFDALMKRFGVGEPPAGPVKTNSKPFNILDYAHTADHVGAMAGQLDVLLKDATDTAASPVLDKCVADAKSVLTHAAMLLAGVIGFTFACAFIYRSLARNRSKPAG
jgi:hypothetical protein